MFLRTGLLETKTNKNVILHAPIFRSRKQPYCTVKSCAIRINDCIWCRIGAVTLVKQL